MPGPYATFWICSALGLLGLGAILVFFVDVVLENWDWKGDFEALVRFLFSEKSDNPVPTAKPPVAFARLEGVYQARAIREKQPRSETLSFGPQTVFITPLPLILSRASGDKT